MLNGIRRIGKALFGASVEKYEARHDLLVYFANRLGFRVYNRNLRWIDDPEYLDVWKNFKYTTNDVKDRRYHLYYLAKSVKQVPGDSVECGVFQGAGSYLIVKALEGGGERYHHIFDSFEGLSEPEKRDLESQDHVFKWNKNDLAVPEQVVSEALKEFNNVNCYKGWIPSRFEEVANRTFCFVHIDVDLYQPTMDSISFFYERLNRGGIILCDDYGFDSCPGAFDSMNEFFANKPEAVIPLTTGQAFVVKK